MIEKKVVVNLAVGLSARRRLDEFARSTGLPLGVVLERAIMAYEPAVSVAPPELESRVEALEKALAALSVEAAPIYQADTKPAEIALETAIGHHPNLDDGGALAAAHPVSGEVKALPETPAVVEKESTPIPSTPSLQKQSLPPIETAIKELGRQSHGQQAIAHELNRRGYRTSNGTPIRRGYVGNVLKRLGV